MLIVSVFVFINVTDTEINYFSYIYYLYLLPWLWWIKIIITLVRSYIRHSSLLHDTDVLLTGGRVAVTP